MQVEIVHKPAPRYKFIKGSEFPAIANDSPESTFFYIGNNQHILKNLTSVFQFGYSADTIQSAINNLTHIEKKSEPSFLGMFVDIYLNVDELQKLIRFLGSSATLAAVPVIFNTHKLNQSEKALLRKTELVDDFIDLYTDLSLIKEKLLFLRNIKGSLREKDDEVIVETAASAPGGIKYIVKRAFDIVVSGLLILLMVPVFLFIILAIKLESRGPIFYNSYRAGRGYRIFKFFKFRTMKVGADRMVNSLSHLNQYNVAGGPVFFKVSNDPRVTKIGSFLRNTSLDELPQLFNVLKGDMSIVGNRPLPLYEASRLTTDEWAERFVAPAGITGLWQVKRRGKAEMSVEERIGLDLDYARKFNLMMDLWIMLQTPKVLIQESNV
ncbi:MAG: sugar transferase [Chitinophagaceae bacterium]|nr:sugar transferase [Chitinophagaceae bacterium]